ncbi:Site-specific recombinase XerD [Pseudomonas guariconensis]|uniref:tyrosine-type recombinase/integrase n=1 Tax=Pseudomonas guariconensis TaxID=1288410 RepID=UPI00088BE817|nr:tyrosine-type recombinase/integrase [Pseudomonas guariconensis]SDE24682.1 Site-specific recombinase XerD [Pseudomonas guariconensis]
MSVILQSHPVTSGVTTRTIPLRPNCRLASPYHYRRHGIYYLRLRVTGSVNRAVSISLKTTDRRWAMQASGCITSLLQEFHLGHPDASWNDLREHLLTLVSSTLMSADDGHPLRHWGDMYRNVGAIPSAVLAPHSEGTSAATEPVSTPLTFDVLSRLYMTDRGGEQKPTTLKETKLCHKVIAEHLDGLDLRNHSREDLVAFRGRLSEGRMPSTVNKLIVKLSAVFAWAVENGYLSRTYDKKLKLTKGVESTRKAFSQPQVSKLMDYANSLPETSWKRWLLSLGIITGGRLREICQLTTSDVLTMDSGVVAIHINERGEGKSIKNKQSERLVPLTDGAYGFELAAFLRYVDTCRRNGAISLASIDYRSSGEWVNQQAIPAALADSYKRGFVFHSLRHSLASLMQAKGVPTTHAQAVLGHASGTITFDTYGSGVPVQTIAQLLKELFNTGIR